MTAEELYLRFCSLVKEMPELAYGPITPEMNQWMGRATVLVELMGDIVNTVQLKMMCQRLDGALRKANAEAIATIVYQALAKAEMNAPASVQGAFIAAGHTLNAYAAVGKVLETATNDVFMVDPYAGNKAITEYALLAPDKVVVRLMADAAPNKHKKTLKPAAEKWVQQFGKARLLEVRLAAVETMHDRLIVIDGASVWALGQSFNDLAERSHTSLAKMDQQSGALKIAAYEAMWKTATPII
jgi:hypothetical protein